MHFKGVSTIPTLPPASQEEVKQHIDDLCRTLMDTVNAHNTDLHNSPWSEITSTGFRHYGAVFQPPGRDSHQTTNTIGFVEPVSMDLAAYLKSLDYMCRNWPEYRITIVDLSTTVSLRKGTAQVFANLIIHGVGGVSRSALTHLEWLRLRDEGSYGEKWVCLWTKSFAGVSLD